MKMFELALALTISGYGLIMFLEHSYTDSILCFAIAYLLLTRK